MTVSYTGDVANGSSFGCFWKILYRWRGSVYKLIWRELIAYLCLYFIINLTYRHGMTEDNKRLFEKVKVYCSKQIESIPMSFVLGFYVTLIVKRWWDQYWILPMPDSLALYVSASIHGQDERGRILRRTIMRYALLAYIICLQRISFRVKKRFPTLQHLVDTGMMTESEKKIFDLMDAKTKVLKFWMPVVWASNLINRARTEGRVSSDVSVQTILTELSDFRRKLGRVMVYDTVSVPLVYTQVVTLAVYTYFLAALLGRQWVTPPDPSTIYPHHELDLVFPIFLSLQFIFYIGWLKVAETLINPFGEDDDDFELNWLIDRHIKVSYMVVDEMHEEHPELLKDQYWEQVVPADLPYNLASEHFRRHEPQGSTAALKVKASESVYADLPVRQMVDDVYADYESVTDSPLPDSRKSWIQRQWSRVGSLRSTTSSRHRAMSGPLPHHNHHHHRPSLYERILSRRSSKDIRNSDRRGPRPPSALANGALTIAKEGNSATLIIPHPNSRPRVPTPDVTKETILPAKTVPPADAIVLAATVNNPGYGNKPSPPLNMKSREMLPPPPYESPEGSSCSPLPPIAENDGSPYSTSSTARSYKAYPTTTSIFSSRKVSPPPPPDPLPPLPTLTLSLPEDANHHISPLALRETVFDAGIVNDAFEEERGYMTIAEVAETKAAVVDIPPTLPKRRKEEEEEVDDGYDERESPNEEESESGNSGALRRRGAETRRRVLPHDSTGSASSGFEESPGGRGDRDTILLLSPNTHRRPPAPLPPSDTPKKECEVFV